MNDLICSSSLMPLRDRTSNSLMCDIKSSNYLRPIIDRNHQVKKCKTRSHVKHGLLWLDCDSQIRTKLANLWEIFDWILKNGLLICSHLDLNMRHFDSINCLPDVKEQEMISWNLGMWGYLSWHWAKVVSVNMHLKEENDKGDIS
jgi:hypothetical protein